MNKNNTTIQPNVDPIKLVLLLLCFWFCSKAIVVNAAVQELQPLVITEAILKNNRKLDLAPYIQYIEDRNADLPFSRVLKLFPRKFAHFDKPSQTASFGFTKSTFWHTFIVENPSSAKVRTILQLGNPSVDEFDLYVPTETGQFDKRSFGNRYPFYQRDIESTLFTLRLELPPNSRQQYFIRFHTSTTSYFPLKLFFGTAYESEQIFSQLSIGIFVGIVVGLFWYNAFLYWSTRTPIYIYYLGLTFWTGMFIAVRNNLLNQLWPESNEFNALVFYIFPLIWVISMVKFFQVYTETNLYHPLIDRACNWFCVYTLLAMLMLLLKVDMKLFHAIYVVPAFLVSIAFFYVSYMRLKEGYYPILFFLVGLSLPIVAGGLRVAVTIGVINDIHAIEMIANNLDAAQLLIFSLGLASSIAHLSNKKLEKEKLAISANMAGTIKQQFLNKMSFQIRTPLNDVIGGAELLANTELEKDQAYFINVVKNSGSSLLTIVNDIIDLMSSNEAELKLEVKPFNIAGHLEEYMSIFESQIKNKGVPLQIELDRHTPIELMGDTTRIRQLILNLLGNAFKFTEQGCIKLAVTCLDVNYFDKHCDIKITVTDTGMGISAENQEKLFESYVQADASVTRHYGGTGLGLMICQRLVTLMGGTIGFESEEGKGSSFWFVLPLQVVGPEQRQMLSPKLAEKTLADHIKIDKILVAEDDPSNQQVIKAMLTSLGIDSYLVNDGFEVIDEYKRHPKDYDLILLDYVMPNLDGVEAAKKIRRLENELGNRPIPMVAVTAKVMITDRQRCLDAGMDGAIGKPMLIKDFIAEIERLAALGLFTEGAGDET